MEPFNSLFTGTFLVKDKQLKSFEGKISYLNEGDWNMEFNKDGNIIHVTEFDKICKNIYVCFFFYK